VRLWRLLTRTFQVKTARLQHLLRPVTWRFQFFQSLSVSLLVLFWSSSPSSSSSAVVVVKTTENNPTVHVSWFLIILSTYLFVCYLYLCGIFGLITFGDMPVDTVLSQCINERHCDVKLSLLLRRHAVVMQNIAISVCICLSACFSVLLQI